MEDVVNDVPSQIVKDEPSQMTWGRRLALYLMNSKWYYNPPQRGNGESDGGRKSLNSTSLPNLEVAWWFFEHITLPRFLKGKENQNGEESGEAQSPESMSSPFTNPCNRDLQLEKAEPGDPQPSDLYPCHTPLGQLGDFGLGVGIYFSTLRSFAILTLLAGLINIPNLVYFASDDYSQGKDLGLFFVQRSAVCTDREWVPCPSCRHFDFYNRTFGLGDFVGRVHHLFLFEDVEGGTGNYLNVTGVPDYEEFLENYNITISGKFVNIEDSKYECSFLGCRKTFMAEENGRSYWYVGDSTSFGDVQLSTVLERSNCNGATAQQGFINYASLFFMFLGTIYIHYKQDKLLVELDDDEQTAQDYSIQIMNPPKNAVDPKEWKDFFESAFDGVQVTFCCIDRHNDDFVQLLIQRRELRRQLEFALPFGTPLDKESLEEEAQKDRKIAALVKQLNKTIDKLKEDHSEPQDRDASTVFITFDRQSHQREVLSTMGYGRATDDKYKFGDKELNVIEPEEPSAIRWQELETPFEKRAIGLFATTMVVFASIVIGCIIIMSIYAAGHSFVASTVTTIFTSMFPSFAKFLMSKESHYSESMRQKWLFLKIAVFNISVTTFLLTLIYPFTSTLDEREGSVSGLIGAVHSLLFSQLIFSPALQIADIGGNVSRHIMAPRAKTQEQMNLCMAGTEVSLAERYANLIKFLFLVLWFSALFPGGFILGSIALFIVYFTDRFSLMRTWTLPAQLGTNVADFARSFFLPAAVFFMALISAYAWSGFPYDNACEDFDTDLPQSMIGNWTETIEEVKTSLFGFDLFHLPERNVNYTIREDSQVYKYCNQDLRDTNGGFPPLPSRQPAGVEWMESDQENVLWFFGATCISILIIVIGLYIDKLVFRKKGYREDSIVDPTKFSEVKQIDTYIPEARSPFFNFPLILVNVDGIDERLYGWNDPWNKHSFYSISKDLQEELGDGFDTRKADYLFSKVKYWKCDEEDLEKKEEVDVDVNKMVEELASVLNTANDMNVVDAGDRKDDPTYAIEEMVEHMEKVLDNEVREVIGSGSSDK